MPDSPCSFDKGFRKGLGLRISLGLRFSDLEYLVAEQERGWFVTQVLDLSVAGRYYGPADFPLRPVAIARQKGVERVMTQTTNDPELVKRAKKGDLEAFEALVNRYERPVYTVVLRMLRHQQDAEDVTQQTFLSALEHLPAFREEASFGTWLFRIATHAALKVIRKRKGLITVSLEEATNPRESDDHISHPEFIADWRQSTEELVHAAEIRRLLDSALEELDEKHRLVFLLRDVEGLSVRETAQVLDLSEANTKVRLLRARLQLREKLTRWLGDPEKALVRHGDADEERQKP